VSGQCFYFLGYYMNTSIAVENHQRKSGFHVRVKVEGEVPPPPLGCIFPKVFKRLRAHYLELEAQTKGVDTIR
jgi:hypothetical protein